MKFTDDPILTPKEKEYFRNLLTDRLNTIESGSVSTRQNLKKTNKNIPDPTDRASDISSQSTTLRIHDRQRKLIKKIKQSLERLEKGLYNTCSNCENPIGKSRLNARPVTNMCISCKEKEEQHEYLQN